MAEDLRRDEIEEELERRVAERTAELTAVNKELRREVLNLRRIEEALRGNERLLQRLLENIPGGSVNVFDRDFRYLFATGRGLSQVGLRAENLIGRTISDMFSAESVDYVACYYRRAFDGETVDFELPVGGRWYQIIAAPFEESRGRVETIIAVAQDITERRHVEERLRQSESQLEEAQRLASLGSWSWDLHNDVLTWSYELYRIFGIHPQTFDPSIERLVEEFIIRDDRELFRSATANTLRTHDPFNFYYRISRADGETRIIHARGGVASDENGQAVRMFGTAQDVTERRLVEERMRSQLDFTEAITDGLGEGVMALDREGRVTFMNAAAEAMLGWSQSELLGKMFQQVVPLRRTDEARQPTDETPIQDVLRSGRTVRVETYVFTHRDGTTFPVFCTSSPIIAGGQAAGAALAFHDITEDIRIKEMLQSFSQRLIEAQEAERRRVARELHDEIGQTLTAIKLNLQSLRVSRRAAPQLRDSADLVDGALRQIRELSLDLRPVQLDDLGLMAALRWHVDRESRRAGLVPEFSADLSGARLPTELETACFRIAQEALTNVVRHARASRVWVELTRQDSELELRVRDDGAGFDVDVVQTPGVSAVNLGLRGMQERALLVGGRIEIISSPGRGTEVRARFPVPPDSPFVKDEVTIE